MLQKAKSGTGIKAHASIFDIHLRRHPLVYYVLDMLESREITEHTDWREKATIAISLRLGRCGVLRSLRHYMWHVGSMPDTSQHHSPEEQRRDV